MLFNIDYRENIERCFEESKTFKLEENLKKVKFLFRKKIEMGYLYKPILVLHPDVLNYRIIINVVKGKRNCKIKSRSNM